jgi:very-short-patch-repair endonuclease
MREQDKRWRTSRDLWEKLKPIAHEKRHELTPAEKEIWKYLRNRQINNFIFRRQHCIGQFIVDFCCYKAKLVIEVDGDIHLYRPEEDKARQEYLESLGFRVMRFSNEIILNKVKEVLKQIEYSLSDTE